MALWGLRYRGNTLSAVDWCPVKRLSLFVLSPLPHTGATSYSSTCNHTHSCPPSISSSWHFHKPSLQQIIFLTNELTTDTSMNMPNEEFFLFQSSLLMCVSLQSERKGSKKCSWFWCIYTKNEFRNFFNFSESLIEKIVTLVLWVSSVVHRNKGVFFAVVLRLMWWCFSACECLCGLLSTWERAACDRPHRKHIRGNSKEPTHVYILILTSRASYLDLHLSK